MHESNQLDIIAPFYLFILYTMKKIRNKVNKDDKKQQQIYNQRSRI